MTRCRSGAAATAEPELKAIRAAAAATNAPRRSSLRVRSRGVDQLPHDDAGAGERAVAEHIARDALERGHQAGERADRRQGRERGDHGAPHAQRVPAVGPLGHPHPSLHAGGEAVDGALDRPDAGAGVGCDRGRRRTTVWRGRRSRRWRRRRQAGRECGIRGYASWLKCRHRAPTTRALLGDLDVRRSALLLPESRTPDFTPNRPRIIGRWHSSGFRRPGRASSRRRALR